MPKMCPDDKMPLYERRIHGLSVDICLHCGGMWLDRGEVARIRQMAQEQVQDFDDATPKSQAPRSSNPACPMCAKALEPFHYCSGDALLERCPDLHGIWVPEEQLAKIVKPVNPEAIALMAELSVKSDRERARHQVLDEALKMLSWRRGWLTFWGW